MTTQRRTWIALASIAVLALGVAAALLLPRLGDTAEQTPAAAAAAASAVTPSAAPKTLSVEGAILLGLGDFEWDKIGQVGQPGPWCAGRGGYDDVTTGATVTVTDADGSVIGLGELDVSLPTGLSDNGTPTSCELRFNVVGVPAGKGFYGVEVSHRGAVKFDEADLAEPIELSLG